LACNWLQIMENSVDPVHAEWLHGRYSDYVNQRIGGKVAGFTRKHRKIGFDVIDYGIIKRRLIEGEADESDDWQGGHPLIFPNMVRFGAGGHYTLEIRVPLDDTHTWQLWYTVYRPRIPLEPQDSVPIYDVSIYDAEEGSSPISGAARTPWPGLHRARASPGSSSIWECPTRA